MITWIVLLLTSVLGIALSGECDEQTNKCLIDLSRVTSFDQCGMPPSTAAQAIDPETLEWGLCACPQLVPIFECFQKSYKICPGAKQYMDFYGDQVDKGCKVVDWVRKKQGTKKHQIF